MSLITACREFGTASINLGAAAYHSYRAASRYLKVPISIGAGLAGVAAVAWISRIAFRQISAALATPPPPKTNHKHHYHTFRPIPEPISNEKQAPSTQQIPSPAPKSLVPHCEVVAKERNEALSRLLGLLDKYLIDPWIVKNKKLLNKGEGIDPLFDAMLNDEAGLQSYLRVAALWHLSIGWEYGEKKYLEKELPSPPTLETISLEVQTLSLDKTLEDQLLRIIASEEEEKVLAYLKAINDSSLTNGTKLTALGLSIKLDNVLKQANQVDQSEEKAKLQSDFAFGMNNYLANFLVHTSLFLEDVMKARQKAGSPLPRSTITTTSIQATSHQLQQANLPQPEQQIEITTQTSQRRIHIEQEVEEVVKTLSRELSTRYTDPLYTKEKSKISKNIDQHKQEDTDVDKYLKGTITEEAFLNSEQAKALSTSELTSLFFIKMLTLIEGRVEFKDFTLRLPKSLLDHVKPSIVNLIDKSMGMIENLDMENTVVNFFLFLDQIFDCCEVVQKAQQTETEETDITQDRAAFKQALVAGGVAEDTAGTFIDLYSPITLDDVQGTDIIEGLEDNAHPNVQAENPHLTEREWLEEKVRSIKLLLRNTAVDYDGQWLSKLLKEKGGSTGKGFIQLVQRANDTIKTYSPLLGKVIDFVILGAQAFIENEGINAVQEAIHNLSKPGKLSSLICVSVIKSYCDTYKEDEQDNTKTEDDKQKDLELIRTIYAFLSTEEQQKIHKHLEYIYKDDNPTEKIQQFTNNIQRDNSIVTILEQESRYDQALVAIQQAGFALSKNPQQNQKHITELQKAYEAIEIERGLSQFERSKILIKLVAEHELKKIISYDLGYIVASIVAVIQGAFNLLKYQKVVKHLLFKVIDLVIDELNVSQTPEEAEEAPKDHTNKQTRSIFEIAENTIQFFDVNGQDQELSLATRTQQRLVSFVDACNSSQWGVTWGIGRIASLSTNWFPTLSFKGWSANAGATIWEQIKKAKEKKKTNGPEPKTLNENARITSKNVSEKVAKIIFDLGKDPNRLSAEIIEKLSEIRNPNPDPEPPETIIPHNNEIHVVVEPNNNNRDNTTNNSTTTSNMNELD
ncbi:MAG: hypothetical protein KDK71_05690 [Chlamydiia bacterium]|nr:hypothetical protein [Chlamydiia bacterium]